MRDEQQRRWPHEHAAERERRPAGPRRAVAGRAAPTAVADPHRAGRGDAERHHEGGRGDVERDLVRGARHRVEAAGQRRGRREGDDFDRDLQRGREARDATAAPAAAREMCRDTVGRSRCRARGRSGGRPATAPPPCRGGTATVAQAAPGTPSAGMPSIAVDQQPVGGGVDQVGGDQREGHRDHGVDALQVAAQRRVEQQRQRAPDDDAEVALQERHHLRMEAERGDGSQDRRARPA